MCVRPSLHDAVCFLFWVCREVFDNAIVFPPSQQSSIVFSNARFCFSLFPYLPTEATIVFHETRMFFVPFPVYAFIVLNLFLYKMSRRSSKLSGCPMQGAFLGH